MWLGEARPGEARCGMVRFGPARNGKARFLKGNNFIKVRHGQAGYGLAR